MSFRPFEKRRFEIDLKFKFVGNLEYIYYRLLADTPCRVAN